jgi:hypothetical protein
VLHETRCSPEHEAPQVIHTMFGFKKTLVASETRIASTYIRGISEVISQISLVISKGNY